MKYFEFGRENPKVMVMLHGGGVSYRGMLSAAKEKDMQKSDIEAITGARILADMESSCFKKVCCNVYLTEF